MTLLKQKPMRNKPIKCELNLCTKWQKKKNCIPSTKWLITKQPPVVNGLKAPGTCNSLVLLLLFAAAWMSAQIRSGGECLLWSSLCPSHSPPAVLLYSALQLSTQRGLSNLWALIRIVFPPFFIHSCQLPGRKFRENLFPRSIVSPNLQCKLWFTLAGKIETEFIMQSLKAKILNDQLNIPKACMKISQ